MSGQVQAAEIPHQVPEDDGVLAQELVGVDHLDGQREVRLTRQQTSIKLYSPTIRTCGYTFVLTWSPSFSIRVSSSLRSTKGLRYGTDTDWGLGRLVPMPSWQSHAHCIAPVSFTALQIQGYQPHLKVIRLVCGTDRHLLQAAGQAGCGYTVTRSLGVVQALQRSSNTVAARQWRRAASLLLP